MYNMKYKSNERDKSKNIIYVLFGYNEYEMCWVQNFLGWDINIGHEVQK